MPTGKKDFALSIHPGGGNSVHRYRNEGGLVALQTHDAGLVIRAAPGVMTLWQTGGSEYLADAIPNLLHKLGTFAPHQTTGESSWVYDQIYRDYDQQQRDRHMAEAEALKFILDEHDIAY